MINSEDLKEYFDVSQLSEREQAKYWLISRYEAQVSSRLLKEKRVLRESATTACSNFFSNLIKTKNPFLELLSKEEAGPFYPIPIISVDEANVSE